MKSLNKIACFLMLCWMVVIFMFSAEPDTESSELSGSVSYRIVSVVNTITASHWDEKELLDKAELIDYPVRKCAHMSEYAILTLLGFLTFSFLHGRRRFLIPIGVTFLYAMFFRPASILLLYRLNVKTATKFGTYNHAYHHACYHDCYCSHLTV